MWPMDGIGRSAGANAVEGALSKVKDLIAGGNADAVQKFLDEHLVKYQDLPFVKEFMTMWGDIKAGYDSLTPAQRAAFWAAVIVMLTKIMAA